MRILGTHTRRASKSPVPRERLTLTEAATQQLDQAQIRSKVEEIWKIVLQVPSIEPDDDFYGLGGDSLNAVEVTAGVEMLLGIVIDPFEILEHPVFREFVQFLVRFIAEEASHVPRHEASP